MYRWQHTTQGQGSLRQHSSELDKHRATVICGVPYVRYRVELQIDGSLECGVSIDIEISYVLKLWGLFGS